MFERFKIIAVACLVFAGLHLCAAAPSRAGQIDTGQVAEQPQKGFLGITEKQRYDISFKQASLREVLQFLSWIGDINIMMPTGLEGVVDVNFRRVTVEAALNAIIRANKLEYSLEGEVVRIGSTEQFADTGEDLQTETFALRYAPAVDMAEKVKVLLSGRGSVIADTRTNTITVRELPANIDKVSRFLQDVDIKDAQVLIESKIVEATRRFTRALGIQWGLTRGVDGDTFNFAGVSAVGQANSGRDLNVNMEFDQVTATSGMLVGSLIGGTNLDLQILAAERRGDLYVISDPSIVTSNGQSANIRSGATLLLQSTGGTTTTEGGTTTTTGSSLEEKKTGVELTVTPQITVQDFVKLDIKAETSTPDFSRTIQGIPVIIDNTATTTVLVKDGETTVIGGLSRMADALSKNRVPYLSSIPVLGNLFKSKEREAENTELMIFIKPTVIRTEGRDPAQMRVREIEERQRAMILEPILKPEDEKGRKKRTFKNGNRGNKYVR